MQQECVLLEQKLRERQRRPHIAAVHRHIIVAAEDISVCRRSAESVINAHCAGVCTEMKEPRDLAAVNAYRDFAAFAEPLTSEIWQALAFTAKHIDIRLGELGLKHRPVALLRRKPRSFDGDFSVADNVALFHHKY